MHTHHRHHPDAAARPCMCTHKRLLSPGGGMGYLVVVQDNKPEEVMALMREGGLRAEVRLSCVYVRGVVSGSLARGLVG